MIRCRMGGMVRFFAAAADVSRLIQAVSPRVVVAPARRKEVRARSGAIGTAECDLDHQDTSFWGLYGLL